MKFDVLSLIDGNAMEDGVWLHLTSPIDGEPLYRDPEEKTLPCRAKVRSSECERITAYTQRHLASTTARMQRLSAKKRIELSQEMASERTRGVFAIQLVALDNATSEKPGIVEVSEEEAFEIFVDPTLQWLVAQVVVFSNDPASFGLEARPTPDAGAPAGGKTKTTQRS